MEDELLLERATPHNIVARRCRSAASHYTKSALEPAHAKSGDKHASKRPALRTAMAPVVRRISIIYLLPVWGLLSD